MSTRRRSPSPWEAAQVFPPPRGVVRRTLLSARIRAAARWSRYTPVEPFRPPVARGVVAFGEVLPMRPRCLACERPTPCPCEQVGASNG